MQVSRILARTLARMREAVGEQSGWRTPPHLRLP
jgi:hypothetical protein